jgi:hypothetical protein
MKAELAGIKAKVHSASKAASTDQDLLTALAKVKAHTSRARELLRKGQADSAREELDKSLDALEKASTLSQDIAADAGSGLGAAWSTVKDDVGRAWNEVSRQIEEGKLKSKGEKGKE